MNNSEIKQLLLPLERHYLSAFDEITKSEVSLVADINRHLKSVRGKQLRPKLTMLAAACCGLTPIDEPHHPLFSISAAIEILHTSTLIHDDIIDDSNIRRGIPTVKNQWNNKTAVLLGDFYLACVMQTLNHVNNNTVTAIIDHAVIEMSEGELMQQETSGKYPTDSHTYFNIIWKKTAVFISACCKAGAVIADADRETCDIMQNYGLNFGIAFQINDDILDYLPSDVTGKPQGNDLREHKCTLPLNIALNDSDANTQKKIRTLLQQIDTNDDAVQEISHLVKQCGALSKAANIAEQYIQDAVKDILHFPKSPYRDAMESLAKSINTTTKENLK